MNKAEYYRSEKWEELRDNVLQRDGNLCQECKSNGERTLATHVFRQFDDDYLDYDESRCESLCEKCFMQKMRQKAHFYSGNKVIGFNLETKEFKSFDSAREACRYIGYDERRGLWMYQSENGGRVCAVDNGCININGWLFFSENKIAYAIHKKKRGIE